MLRPRHAPFAALAFTFLVIARSADAGSTGTAGGTGGDYSYSLTCGPSAMLVGVHAKSGTYVDNLEPICAMFYSDGTLLQVNTVAQPQANPGAGTNTAVQCGNGFAISGFKGSGGGWIDSLVFGCRNVGPNGVLEGATSFLSRLGGTGGTPFSFKECPSNKPGMRIFGKSGLYIDSFAIDCVIPTLSPPISSPPSIQPAPVLIIGGGSTLSLPDLVPTHSGPVLRHENAFRKISNSFCNNLPPAPQVTQARTGQITVGNITWGVINSSNNGTGAASAMRLKAGATVLQNETASALNGGQSDTASYVRPQSTTQVILLDSLTNLATKSQYGGLSASGCFQQVMAAGDPMNWQDPQFTVEVDVNSAIAEVSDGNNNVNF